MMASDGGVGSDEGACWCSCIFSEGMENLANSASFDGVGPARCTLL